MYDSAVDPTLTFVLGGQESLPHFVDTLRVSIVMLLRCSVTTRLIEYTERNQAVEEFGKRGNGTMMSP